MLYAPVVSAGSIVPLVGLCCGLTGAAAAALVSGTLVLGRGKDEVAAGTVLA